MQFYRITGKFNKKTKGDAELLQNSEPAQAGEAEAMEENEQMQRRLRENLRDADSDRKQDIRETTGYFNATKVNKGSAVFFSNCLKSGFSIGAVAGSLEECADMTKRFLSAQGMENVEPLSYEEVTLEIFAKLCRYASRRNFIEDDDEMMASLDLDDLARPGRYGLEVGENLLKKETKRHLQAEANRLMIEGTLLPEIERIYKRTVEKKISGHPVHYLVSSADRDVRRDAYQALLSALFANGRINNLRYVYADFHGGQHFCETVLDELFNSCKGGAFVLRYTSSDEADETEFASSERETIEALSKIINKYRQEVLLILCLSSGCSKSKDLFKEYLPRVTMVEISEDLVSGKRAKSYLRRLCKERGVTADHTLLAKVEGEELFLAAQLKSLFDDWFDNKLKTDYYSQYKEMSSSREEIVKEKPKGSAYEELMGMTGLESAKTVMKNALDYFKAQKVFADKGMVSERPSMHMVFTGNPGTAKTTAARLFARIMKENGVLSKGQLVEVGRGDLVGKYVGHTAPLVQKKFAEAKNSVLFIDEAYSLVDDRDGMYGDEAINTIVAEMENHREDTVVIFAGYPEQMEGFLNKNPGLRSRIAFHVNFEDYGTEDLIHIAEYIAREKGLELTPDAKEKLGLIFEDARKQPDYGNGRFVRNVIEKAKMKQASRLLKMDLDKITEADVKTIAEEDIEMPEEIKGSEEQKVIGFHVA